MAAPQEISALISTFLSAYDAKAMDGVWQDHSQRIHRFWSDRIASAAADPISDSDCDEVIRILDRNGKGNTKDSEAVARAMVPQGAWRRILNEFHSNRALASVVYDLLTESSPERKAALIDRLYKMNAGQKNHLTGPSGNAICAFLAAFDPVSNLSVISLKDRRHVIEFLGLAVTFDWHADSIGLRIVTSNQIILNGIRTLGLVGSARTASRFLYSPTVRPLWKGEHTVIRLDKPVSVTVPTEPEDDEAIVADADSVKESMQIQGLLAKIGTAMGFKIWLPRSDRGRVLKVWHAEQGQLLDELPLGYDSTTTKTIEQIDVLWLNKRSIARAFEVEHTTSVYSGLLRMADLVALVPNINIKLHIVAPAERREKVLQEIRRPVFSLLEGRALSEMCSYLSYDTVREIADLKHLAFTNDDVIEKLAEEQEVE